MTAVLPLANVAVIDQSRNMTAPWYSYFFQTSRTFATTVAGLPSAGTVGRRSFVTDATVTTFASVVAGGGTHGVPVYDDGTSWRIG